MVAAILKLTDFEQRAFSTDENANCLHFFLFGFLQPWPK